ncbi:MAG: 3-dehydroquinate synthase [Flavisolibacter sp.]|nr:3-dehydroquinate synthase [Flavisolibacter sp.]
MTVQQFSFAHKKTGFHFDASISELKKREDGKKAVIITDEHIYATHKMKFKGWHTIVLKSGEEYKVQSTVDSIIEQLIELRADRKTLLVGVGGGVITDLTGYTASIFLRGVPFGFVPTTILAMVDAAIGGKNGVDVGVHKNMVGITRQPDFILYDIRFLKTLPEAEWRNGFAEIIKHAAIMDEKLFKELEQHSIAYFQKKKAALQKLVQRNALLKIKVVQQDEFEQNERRLLNFGHTLAHALEKQYELMHGEAVAIGMAFAGELSQKLLSFKEAARLISLIDRYQLPVSAGYNKKKVFEILVSDKKREGDFIHFVLLQKIGKAVIQKIPLEKLYQYI